MYRGPKLAPAGVLQLGADADNIRLDVDNRQAYVGYGDGALAVIDVAAQRKVRDIALAGHPESFQLESSGPRIFVNVPQAQSVAVVDRRTHRQVAAWPTQELRANYPMAIDPARSRVLVGIRQPPSLVAFDATDGRALSKTAACGDCDDVFLDTRRGCIYLSCGEGFIDVFAERKGSYSRISRIATVKGARTALFSADADRLFLAVRADAAGSAAIWVLKPQ
jgi:hypothetical protein